MCFALFDSADFLIFEVYEKTYRRWQSDHTVKPNKSQSQANYVQINVWNGN